jgi:CHAD domain-containing protein
MDEKEVKLSAEQGFELPDLSRVWDAVTSTPRADEHLSTVYLDSEDLRLARWGLSFRYRDGQGWTVKLPTEESGPLLVRDELVFQGTPETPPAEAVDLVSGYLRGAELRPRVHLSTLRRGALLRDPHRRLLADVVDDAVSVLDGGRGLDRFRELEVETRPATPPELVEAVVARLRDAGAGSPDPTPKYLRAIGGPEAAPAEIVLPALSHAASLGEVVKHAIGAGVTRLVRHDPVVRLDTDPEGVHQARVATRRLRSDLRTFRAALDRQWAKGLREELGWLGRELGAARDADVMLARLSARADALPEASAGGAREVIAGLKQRRAQAHARMLEQMRGDRYLALLDKLIQAAQAPALIERKAARPAAKALRPLVRKEWRVLEKKVGSLSDRPADEELHMVRILAKRCRYAAEASAPVLGKRTRHLATAAADLQDTLGELHDAVVAEHWLRDWAQHAPSSAGAFAAGELAALERTAASQARARWPRAWKRAGRALPPERGS